MNGRLAVWAVLCWACLGPLGAAGQVEGVGSAPSPDTAISRLEIWWPAGDSLPLPGDSAAVAAYAPAALPLHARRKAVPRGEFNSLTIPLKRAGNLLLVEARAGDLEGNFILDLGAPYLVLNRTYFRSYEYVQGALASDVTGRSTPVFHTSLPLLQIRDLYYEDIDADVADLGEIENRRGTRILGLLGVELFLNLGLTVDVMQDVMYLHRLDEQGERLEPDGLDSRRPGLVAPFDLQENAVVFDVIIAGRPLRFALDSGAEVNVLHFGVNRKVLHQLRVDQRVTLHGAAGGSSRVLAGTLPEFSLGGRKFIGGKTIVANLEALGKSSEGRVLDGMLGHGFLEQGIVRLDFLRKEMRWYPFFEPTASTGTDR
jgi:hypothetical protein